jgi:hypothetical protein
LYAYWIAAIILGELSASLFKGVPIPWKRFNLSRLLICMVLPFQKETVNGFAHRYDWKFFGRA